MRNQRLDHLITDARRIEQGNEGVQVHIRRVQLEGAVDEPKIMAAPFAVFKLRLGVLAKNRMKFSPLAAKPMVRPAASM